MSIKLYDIALSFVQEKIDANDFSNEYIRLWKDEGEAGILQLDPEPLNGKLSMIFCLADMYSSEADRTEYEFDEATTREKIKKVIEFSGSVYDHADDFL